MELSALQIIVALLVNTLGTLGIAKLIGKVVDRYYSKQDELKKSHTTAVEKQYDADQLAMNILHEEVKDFRKSVSELRKELRESEREKAELSKDNAVLKIQERHLAETAERQEGMIKELHDDLRLTKDLLREAKITINKINERNTALREEVTYTSTELISLKKELELLRNGGEL